MKRKIMTILLILCASIGTASAQDNTKAANATVEGATRSIWQLIPQAVFKFSRNGAA